LQLVEQDIQILLQKLMPERRILPRAGNVVLGYRRIGFEAATAHLNPAWLMVTGGS
jgi:hypothetical protein